MLHAATPVGLVRPNPGPAGMGYRGGGRDASDIGMVSRVLRRPRRGRMRGEVQQERPGELPDVEVEEGQVPAYEVETGGAEVQRDTVTVPEIEVEEPDRMERPQR